MLGAPPAHMNATVRTSRHGYAVRLLDLVQQSFPVLGSVVGVTGEVRLALDLGARCGDEVVDAADQPAVAGCLALVGDALSLSPIHWLSPYNWISVQ